MDVLDDAVTVPRSRSRRASPDIGLADVLEHTEGLEVRVRPGELPEHGQRLYETLGVRVVYDATAPAVRPVVDRWRR